MSAERITKAFKAIKAGCKRVKVHQAVDGLLCTDGDHELTLWVDTPEGLLPERTWDSLDLFLLDVEDREIRGPAREPVGVAVSAKEWETIVWAGLATDQESTRYQLGGVLFCGQGVTATDGRRLHRAVTVADFGDQYTRIVPLLAVKAVSALIKLFKDRSVLVDFDAQINCVVVCGEKWKYKTRLVEGRYPNWERVCFHLQSEPTSEVLLFESHLTAAKAAVARHKLEIKAGTAVEDFVPWQEIASARDRLDACRIDPKYLVDGLALLKGSKSITGKVWDNHHQRDLVILGDNRSFALIVGGGWTTPKAKPNDEKVEELQDART
jgi:hypothetical protein